jgi:hypothetical protein
MSHSCDSGDCWLSRSLQGRAESRPKFDLFQRVETTFVNEFGEAFVDRGIVLGVCLNPPHWSKPGWVYWIEWTDSPSSPHIPLPCFDESHESELRLEVLACC